uniref:Calcipressin-like protein n=1 Tax=Plectus sambesii TaxID=2011161 RepID=A0A914WMC7_9BILA
MGSSKLEMGSRSEESKKLDMPKATANDADHYLNVPPLEKQFLISPPASPPVGWEQQREMDPVVCSFDLMARLAAFAVADTTYEVHPGTDQHPAIIVHPADKDEIPDPETPYSGGSRKIPHTPRPPAESISTA